MAANHDGHGDGDGDDDDDDDERELGPLLVMTIQLPRHKQPQHSEIGHPNCPLLPMDAAGDVDCDFDGACGSGRPEGGGRGTCRGARRSLNSPRKSKSHPKRFGLPRIQFNSQLRCKHSVPCATEPPHGLLVAS